MKGLKTLVIYIDTLICVNIFIDYILLYAIKRLLHINSKHFRIVPASLFAGISTLLVFLPIHSIVISFILRMVTASITVLIAFSFSNITKFIVRTLSYIGTGMLLCALVILIEFLWNPANCAVYNDVIYFDISPVLLISATLITYTALCIYQKLSSKNKLCCAVKTVSIQISDKNCLSFESAIDTGCNLKEPFSGLPVILVEKELIDVSSINKTKLRVIPFSTASGSDTIIGFKPQKVFIDNKQLLSGCYIGVCNNKLHGEIKSLMGYEIWEAI